MNSKILGLVPARHGSRGIVRKNLRPLRGRSLMERLAGCVASTAGIDRLVVSTESAEIAAAAQRHGFDVPFMRPAALAQDDTPMSAVIGHALAELERQHWIPDIVILLQLTAPLRKPEHIETAIQLIETGEFDSVVSVYPLPATHSPDYVMRVDDGYLRPFLEAGSQCSRRQDVQTAYVRDGTIYAFRAETFSKTGTIYGARCRPMILDAADVVCLDTEADWQRAEARLG